MVTFERKKVMPEERRIMLGDTPPLYRLKIKDVYPGSVLAG